MPKTTAYISHAWRKPQKGKKTPHPIITPLVTALEPHFEVQVDFNSIGYKENIKEFEQRLAKGDRIVMLVSDAFLKSKHCMYEMLMVKQKGNVYNRIFPIVFDDAKIYDAGGKIEYLKYWEDEIKKLNDKTKSLGSLAHTEEIQAEINHYTEFRAIISEMTGLLSSMNVLRPEVHLKSGFKALLAAMGVNKSKVEIKNSKDFAEKMARTLAIFDKAISIIENEIEQESVKADNILKQVKYWQKQCQDKKFQIGVMAMVKAGKSTFLNAVMGDDILPSTNLPETAVPIRIIHTNNTEPKLVTSKTEITGTADIRKFIEERNEEQRKKGSKDTIDHALYTRILALSEKNLDGIQLEILDTAGHGEHMTSPTDQITSAKSINKVNEEVLDEISAIIYILDYSHLKTDGEAKELEKIPKIRTDIAEKLQDRMFFILNQIDRKDRHGKPIEETIDLVYKHIKGWMPGLKKDQFYQLSASRALLSRLILNGKANAKATEDFEKIAFGETVEDREEYEYKEYANKILDKSNITVIEDNIINFLYENRGRLFIETILDNLKRLLNEFNNKFVVTAQATLKATIGEIEELEKKTSFAKKSNESIQADAEKFETEIKEWIEEEFKKFETSIQDNIDSVFNEDKLSARSKFFNKVIPHKVLELHKKINQLFSSSKSQVKSFTEEKVDELNYEIHEYLFEHFNEFKTQLESKLHEKQTELLNKLGENINTLAREFESVVKKALNVNLEPIELEMDIIYFEKILADANAYMDKFIAEEKVVQKQQIAQQVYKKYWCSDDGRYVTQYRTVHVMTNEYKISKSSLEIFWKDSIQEMNQVAKKMANKVIERQIKSEIRSAKNSFDNYINEYITIIQENKIILSSGNVGKIERRLTGLQSLSEEMIKLIDQVKTLN